MAQSIHVTKNPNDTQKLAQQLAQTIKPGSVLALAGDLGSGKTTFVQALAKSYGINRPLTSPTFLYIRTYPLEPKGFFVHVDLYRVGTTDEAVNLHMLDYIAPTNIVVIEWPKIIIDFLPVDTIHIFFAYGKQAAERIITIKTATPHQ